MIGLERGVVKLVPYAADWKNAFEAEKLRLQAVIGDYIRDVQHVGSTSIPGGVAKPIIDMAVAVDSFEDAFACVEPIKCLGYEYKGENGIARRHFFVKRDPKTTHHLHMSELGSRAWENQILFRDYLLGHPEAVKAYTAIKLRLARQFPLDREVYTNGKGPFIEHILHLARSGST